MTMTSPAKADPDVVVPPRPRPRRGVSLLDAGPPIALVVIVVSAIPVWIAQRLTSGSGGSGRGVGG